MQHIVNIAERVLERPLSFQPNSLRYPLDPLSFRVARWYDMAGKRRKRQVRTERLVRDDSPDFLSSGVGVAFGLSADSGLVDGNRPVASRRR